MKRILIALVAVLMLSGSAFAANQVFNNVTSEPITQFSTCDKAGGFSLQFDTDTILMVGDVITIDTTLGSTLCKEVDLEISNGGNGGVWTNVVVMAQDNTGPVYYIDDPATPGDLAMVGAGIYFRLYGAVGTQRLTLTVLGAAGDALTVGSDAGDRLVVVFLDQKTNATHFLVNGIWNDFDNDGVYGELTEDATLSDNTLCINVSLLPAATTVVRGSMDSAGDKFTFIPSDPEIAHVVLPSTLVCGACKTPGTPNLVVAAAQSTCLFDYEDGTGVGSSYCTTFTGSQINLTAPSWIDANTYQVEYTITSPATGVYFTDPTLAVTGADVLYDDNLGGHDVCAGVPVTLGVALAPWTAYNVTSGATVANLVTAFNSGDCAPTAAQGALQVLSAAFPIGGNTVHALKFDLPNMVYDNNVVAAGTTVTVRVRLLKPPCGEVATCTRVVGNFVSDCTTPPAPTTTLSLPYLTDPTGGWWSGMAITNTADTAATATITVYEADGDAGTVTGIPIAARGIYVTLSSTLLASLTAAPGNPGTLGDANFQAVVTTNQSASEAFVMIGDNVQGMGYVKP